MHPKRKRGISSAQQSFKAGIRSKGTGGFFNGKDPNVSLSFLQENWVDGAKVIYIGKAGGATLQSRLQQYFSFGQGKNVGHQGGRLIWQLANSKDLIVSWKTLPNGELREIEKILIKKFVEQFGKRPLAFSK